MRTTSRGNEILGENGILSWVIVSAPSIIKSGLRSSKTWAATAVYARKIDESRRAGERERERERDKFRKEVHGREGLAVVVKRNSKGPQMRE